MSQYTLPQTESTSISKVPQPLPQSHGSLTPILHLPCPTLETTTSLSTPLSAQLHHGITPFSPSTALLEERPPIVLQDLSRQSYLKNSDALRFYLELVRIKRPANSKV